MFANESSRILYIATSAYHRSQFFSLEEWLDAKELVKNRKDLIGMLNNLKQKSVINIGAI